MPSCHRERTPLQLKNFTPNALPLIAQPHDDEFRSFVVVGWTLDDGNLYPVVVEEGRLDHPEVIEDPLRYRRLF
jgi:hypothetical protein